MNSLYKKVLISSLLAATLIGCGGGDSGNTTTSGGSNTNTTTGGSDTNTTTGGNHGSTITLTKLGSYDTTGSVKDVTISKDGTKAYVADGNEGLLILDINDSANPAQLGLYDTYGNANKVVISSDETKAYIADGSDGLKIIDISDSTNPIKLGSYDTIYDTESVTLSDDNTKVYMADGDGGLRIIDITDSTNPTLVGSYSYGGDDWTYSLVLSNNGTKAYIAEGDGGLKIVDVSDVTNPILLGSYQSSDYDIKSVALSHDETKAYVTVGYYGLVILDISNSSNIVKLGSFDTDGSSRDVIVSNDNTKAYVSDSNKGFIVVDVTNPAKPLKLSSYDTDGSTYGVTLSPDDSKIYVADSHSGLIVMGSGVISKNGLIYNTITSAITGKVWLDRNLGSNKVCASLDDEACYGDYYQWGRNADGHEKKNSPTTTTQSASGKFVIGYYDWSATDQNATYRSQTWNPCPAGFRVPTADEFRAEDLADSNDSFNKLKMVSAGLRSDADGIVYYKNFSGHYWTTTIDENPENTYTTVIDLTLQEGSRIVSGTVHLADGESVRCIQQ